MKIHVFAVERRLIDLEVTGVEHDPAWCLDRDRDRVGHAMCHPQELERERAHLHSLAWPHALQPCLTRLVVFIQLRFDEGQRQRGSVHGAVEIRQHVRDGADVVLVAVGQHER